MLLIVSYIYSTDTGVSVATIFFNPPPPSLLTYLATIPLSPACTSPPNNLTPQPPSTFNMTLKQTLTATHSFSDDFGGVNWRKAHRVYLACSLDACRHNLNSVRAISFSFQIIITKEGTSIIHSSRIQVITHFFHR